MSRMSEKAGNSSSEMLSATSSLSAQRGRNTKASRLIPKVALCILGLHFAQYAIEGSQTFWGSVSNSPTDDSIGTIKWFKCDETVASGMDCGSVVVPLDHFNLTKGSSTLALARYKATSNPKRGTVFLNPGGPGGSGVQFALGAAPLLAQMLGPYYDLVGFDPRGIGKSVPKVQCFQNPVHRQFFVSNTVFEQGFSVSSNLSDPRTRDDLVQQYKQFLTLKKTQAELCAENMGEELRYMGTATVARDIEFMTTIMDGEDALINYFGASYGTILGAYLVNMFPDRVGRVAIDGVANPVLWAAKPSQFWHKDWISSAEDTFQVFLKECSEAGPKLCPLAKYEREDSEKIETRIDDFLDQLYESPLPVPYARRPAYLTAGAARGNIGLQRIKAPRSWPEASRNFADAMAGDGSALLNRLLPQYVSTPLPDLSVAVDLSRLAVTCLDSPPPESASDFPTAEGLADIGLDTIQDVSRHFGMSVSISEPDGGCQFWPVKGPERFTGPWNHTLKNPILIVSNTADPVTPIASGRLVNSLLGNSSRLLIQDSPGHCSLALASLCTLNAYRAYFINGTLPPNELVCQVDQSPFPKTKSGLIGEAESLSKEDAQLLAGASEIGQWLNSHKFPGPLG